MVNCTANCGQPMASHNVQLTVYNSTLEGATVVFKCNEGFFPNVTHTGVCQNNSMWHLDPADLVCVNPSGGKDASCSCLYYITKVVHYSTCSGLWLSFSSNGWSDNFTKQYIRGVKDYL